MKLQTDPTVIYALTEGKTELGRPLYKKDLAIDSPYNTLQILRFAAGTDLQSGA